MSDFYQILKREIEPENSLPPAESKKQNFDIEKSTVENLEPKLKSFLKKAPKLSAEKSLKKRRATKTKPESATKKSTEKKLKTNDIFLSAQAANPIWLTMSETAKIGGLQKRTIKRALRSGSLKFRIVEGRYQVDLRSAILYFFSKKKLWNKLNESGIGQYIEKWHS